MVPIEIRKARRAQGLVEFVLVAPIILLFLTIAIDIGRGLHLQLILEQLAHDAGRYATLKDPSTGQLPTPERVASRVDGHFPPPFKPYQLTTNLAAAINGEPAVTCALSCTIRPFLMNAVGTTRGDLTITASASYPRR